VSFKRESRSQVSCREEESQAVCLLFLFALCSAAQETRGEGTRGLPVDVCQDCVEKNS
jgi:hypothetical protein